MTNVLIPTDFSENAWNALKYGVQFFENEPTNFYLLHVNLIELNSAGHDVAANSIIYNPQNTVGIIDHLKEVEKRIEETFPKTTHKFYIQQEHGFFIDGIKKTVENKHIDFIVMGTKGATGLKEVIVGTRTSEVITRVKCPILVVPEKAKYESPKELAFPTDFNNYYKNRVLLTLAEILEINQSATRVLHMTKKDQALTSLQKKNKNYLEDFLQGRVHSFHFLISRNIENALQTFIKENGINMIVMVAKNLNFVQRILFEPTVTKISYHTEIPFLVLHD